MVDIIQGMCVVEHFDACQSQVGLTLDCRSLGLACWNIKGIEDGQGEG